jgi:hypothetical protein
MPSVQENLKKSVFNTEENCNESLIWIRNKNRKSGEPKLLSNPKFLTFDQSLYHAGDSRDINRFGFHAIHNFHLNAATNKKNGNVNATTNKKNGTVNAKAKTEISYEDAVGTFKYMFNKFKKGIYVQIKDNELVTFLPFSNYYYFNDWFEYISIPNDAKDFNLLKDLRKQFEKLTEDDIFWKSSDFQYFDKMKRQAEGNFAKYMRSNNSKRRLNFDRTRWVGNNCIFSADYPVLEGEHSHSVYMDMLYQLTKEKKIPDSQFFLNLRDFPIITKDKTEPYTAIFGDNPPKKLDSKYQDINFLPVLTYTSNKLYQDLVAPSYEDWMAVTKKYYSTEKCKKSGIDHSAYNTKWGSKQAKAVFRGSSTGCGVNYDTNIRLKSLEISKKCPDLLDSKIMAWNDRPRLNKKGVDFNVITNEMINSNPIGDKLSFAELSNYKYILHLDGHGGAVRLGPSMGLNSLLLIPESDTTIWIQEYLEPWKHFVPIAKDLSDLCEKIKWCQDNDKKCEEMAVNCNKLYNVHVSKDGILDHLAKMLTKVSNESSYKKISPLKLKNKPLIIIPFRDDAEHKRGAQRKYLLDYFAAVFDGDYKIIFATQSEDYKFNRGQLLNIGFDHFYKKDPKYTHIILHDVDHIPNYDLLKYYDIIPTNEPIMLASRGSRWSRVPFYEMYDNSGRFDSKLVYRYSLNNEGTFKLFAGAVLSLAPEMFIKSNGFTNLIFGWGLEDDILGMRLVKSGMTHMAYPKEGEIIDIEEEAPLGIGQKLKLLADSTEKFEKKWEHLYFEHFAWKNDGLNTLDYQIINESDNEVIVKINNKTYDTTKYTWKEDKLKDYINKYFNKIQMIKYKYI